LKLKNAFGEILEFYPLSWNPMPDIKQLLHKQCIAYVKQRMFAAEKAFKDAEQASNDDTKSSAGDKYETSREMMQQEKDRNTIQLNEANKLMVALNHISTKSNSGVAETGSLVITASFI
jgi:hypothetical protein